MPRFKVSYKILRQQAEDLKSLAKTMDDYVQRLERVGANLGTEGPFAQILNNVKKLRGQLDASRNFVSRAGDLIQKTVDGYGAAEKRQLKKSGSTKAHSRDFYKRPVFVPSPGGGNTTVNVSNTTTYNVNVSSGSGDIAPPVNGPPPSLPPEVAAQPSEVAAQPASSTPGSSGPALGEGAAVVLGTVGGLAGAGAAVAGISALDRKAKNAALGETSSATSENMAEIDEAIKKARALPEEN
ncbi:MAG: hypothetical protein LBI10_07095 [Deltaproteobacteria bacterium]|jgi:hypothetical protein|nr:hypothetical protein [Deltaproteobacteria bacterium]